MGYGKKLYFEGANVASDYLGTDFFNHLGIQYIDNGLSGEVEHLRGLSNCFTDGLLLNYLGGASPHFGLDQIDTVVGAKRLFVSEDGITRVVGYKKNGFSVISSSVIFGAIADGDFENSKMYLLSEYLNYLITDDGVGVEDKNVNNNNTLHAFPNPFTDKVFIQIPENITSANLEIFDVNGQLVYQQLVQKQQRVVEWNGFNSQNQNLQSGLYVIRLIDRQYQYMQKIQKL